MINFLVQPKVQFFDNNAEELAGGQVFVYLPGTATKTNSYPTLADALAGTNANANPVILNSRGEQNIVVTRPVKVVVTSSTDTDPPTSPINTVDNWSLLSNTFTGLNGNAVFALNDAASAVNSLIFGNAITNANPYIKSTGSDATVGIDFLGKSGNNLLRLTQMAGSVNFVTLTNNVTGLGPGVYATGTDTNIPLSIITQGTGGLYLRSSLISLFDDQPISDSSANEYLKFVKATSAVNEITVTNSATAGQPRLQASGDDTNISLAVLAKGSGTVISGSLTGSTAASWVYANVFQNHTAVLTGTRTVTWPDANVTIIGAGTAADQETGTSATVAVTPAIQQRHASAAKVWVNYTTVSTTAILASYNVSSLTDGGTGITTISYTTAFSSVNYASVGMCGNASTSGNPVSLINISKGTGSVVVYNVNSSQTQADYSDMSVACFGDQ